MEIVGGARTPLSSAVQRTVAAIVIRLASRAQYSKVVQLLQTTQSYADKCLSGRLQPDTAAQSALFGLPPLIRLCSAAALPCTGQHPEQHRVSRSGAHGVHRPGPGAAHHARALRGGFWAHPF